MVLENYVFALFLTILARTILNLLNEDDQLMLMAISNTVHTLDSSNQFLSMNSTSKNRLRKFIDSLEKDSSTTNHSLAFEYAFEWITSQIDTKSPNQHSGNDSWLAQPLAFVTLSLILCMQIE